MRAILATFCALTLAGCTTTSIPPIAAQVAVQYATLRVLEDHPEYAPRILEITSSVRQAAAGDASATVAMIDSLIRSQINWSKLSPADAMVVNTLLLAIRSELEQRIGSGVLDSQAMLTIAQVATWIEQAAASTVGT
jgi:C4-type Zn-finger protein